MRAFRGWAILATCAALAACGTRVMPGDGGDGSAMDRVTPPDTTVLPDGNPPPPDGNPPPPDTTPPPPDGEPPPPDGEPPPPPDGEGPDVIVEDIPVIPDAAPPDVAPPDGGPMCPNGITNACPAAPPGPCADLGDGAMRTITFTGLTNTLNASCQGDMTGAGPDGVVPLTLTATRDVAIVATPTGSDSVVLAVFSAGGCNVAASELRCSNSSVTMGGIARVQLRSLPAGTYWVMVASARGNPALLQATLTTPPPRLPGDVCPGVAVAPDSGPQTLSTAMFLPDADYGTTCGGSTTGRVDAVFSYTLTSARDVTINVSPTGPGSISVDVVTMCGMRSTALPPCTSGSPVTRRFRSQAPGTYYVTVDYAGAPGRTLIAQVTTAAPTMVPVADRCPGAPLTAGTTTSVDLATLSTDHALTCLGGTRPDAVFNFAAPAAGNDVIVNVNAPVGQQAAMQLQSTCGTTNVGPCVISNPSSGGISRNESWQRYSALAPGATHSVLAAVPAMTGMLSARYYTVPAAPPTPVMGNGTCATAHAIPPTGGVFTGNSSMLSADFSDPMGCSGCNAGAGRDAIHRLVLAARSRVVVQATGMGFDPLLYLRTGATCPGATVANACNDDYYGNNSQVSAVLDPGTYYVIVDSCEAGFMAGPRGGGAYTLDVMVLPP